MSSVTLAIEDAIDIHREGRFSGVTVLAVRLVAGALKQGDLLEIRMIDGVLERHSVMGFACFALWRSHPPAAIDDSIGPIGIGVALFTREPRAARIPRAEVRCAITGNVR